MIIINKNSPHSIQNYLNLAERAGGDNVLLEVGTYKLTSDIFIPSGVTFSGVARENCIIDCNEDYSVYIQGKDNYETGTISINDGSTTVTGIGTTFTSAMIGRYIWLSDFWYQIESITSGTVLKITEAYIGSNLSGEDCIISDINIMATIKNLTIINSSGSGIVIKNTREPLLNNINVFDCDIGIEMENCLYPQILCSTNYNGTGGTFTNVVGYFVDFSEFSFNDIGLVVDGGYNSSFFNTSCDYNTNNGLTLINCSDTAYTSNSFMNNGGKGIEITETRDIQFMASSISNNGSDGIKLTSNADRIVINSCPVISNGGYGINIANANCDKNILIGVSAEGNTSGSLSDSGTGTLKSNTVNVL